MLLSPRTRIYPSTRNFNCFELMMYNMISPGASGVSLVISIYLNKGAHENNI